ncbi:Arogenate dehydratase 2-like protein, partial [Drosera capensis]
MLSGITQFSTASPAAAIAPSPSTNPLASSPSRPSSASISDSKTANGFGASARISIESPSKFRRAAVVVLSEPLSSGGGGGRESKSGADGSCLRVAYQGVNGAYSELAAEMAYPNCEPVPCEQFDTAFEAVERWLVDRAVLPIENSLGGSIHRNYDLLLRHRLHIVGEVKLRIRHCLLANPDVKLEDLKRVLSHPQALAQCEHTLSRFGLVREAVDDTAGAAKFVAENKFKDVGAVASAGAAKIYGLNILREDIQDDSDNFTRFLMLARDPIIPGVDKPFKTSILFSLEEGPGALFKALAVFALRNINLTKV